MSMNEEELLRKSHEIVLEIATKLNPTIDYPLEVSSQELALNLQSVLKAKGPLSAQDAECYRELIIGLNEKLKALQIALEQIENLTRLNESLLKEKHLREISQNEFIEDFKVLQTTMEAKLKSLTTHCNSLSLELISTKQLLENSKLCEDELQIEVERLQAELELERFSKISKPPEENLLTAELNSDFDSIKQQFLDSLMSYDTLSSEISQEYEKLLAENSSLQSLLDLAKSDLSAHKQQESLMKSEISSLQTQLNCQSAEIKALKELESTHSSLENIISGLKSQNELYADSLSSLTSDNRALSSALTSAQENSNLQIQALTSKLLQQESMLKSSLTKAKDLEDSNIAQSTQNALLAKRLTSATTSLKTACDELSVLHNELIETQKKNESELEFVANYTLKSSQDHLEQERSLKKLNEILNEKDSELLILREMVAGLQQSKPSYISVKDDLVDQALADFINTRPEPLIINFVREDQGTYLFGSKRVFIKIENGKIIIRVGGGFMRIDEFVELYTPLEVEKLDERKKFENSPMRKSGLGKLGSMLGEKGRQELSAQKAAKIIQETFMSGKTKFATCLAVPRKQNTGEATPLRRNSKKNSLTEQFN